TVAATLGKIVPVVGAEKAGEAVKNGGGVAEQVGAFGSEQLHGSGTLDAVRGVFRREAVKHPQQKSLVFLLDAFENAAGSENNRWLWERLRGHLSRDVSNGALFVIVVTDPRTLSEEAGRLGIEMASIRLDGLSENESRDFVRRYMPAVAEPLITELVELGQ